MSRRPIFRKRRPSVLGWLARWLWRLLVLAGGLWLAGFVLFTLWVATARPPDPAPKVDGIVALTGGDDRVAAGLQLLANKAAPLMMISGAGKGTYLGDFTADNAAAATKYAGAITLGHQAATTRGNALELAGWARAHHMRSLLIVTADYHMPRALLLIAPKLPGVALVGYPVRPPAMTHVFSPATIRLLAVEYSKYLIVRAGADKYFETADQAAPG
jgi:uncharacterized SAM-binding protein YcdF (DUF218 family)